MDSEATQLPLSTRLLTWIETNKKQTLWGALVVLAIGLVVGFIAWQKNEKEIAAEEALTAISVPYTSGVVNRGGDPEAYLKVANEYPTSTAAARALLLAAAEYFDEGKFDQAKSLFEKFRREHGDSPLSGNALLGSAACLEGMGKTADALTAYKDFAEHHPNDIAAPQARYALGNLYEAQNKPELALPLFEQIAMTQPQSSLGSEAGMRAEDIKIKYPKLAPPPTPPPGAAPMISIPAPGSSNTGKPNMLPPASVKSAPSSNTVAPATTNKQPMSPKLLQQCVAGLIYGRFLIKPTAEKI
jgi:tetratricopeptide (TPR) repeat protein